MRYADLKTMHLKTSFTLPFKLLKSYFEVTKLSVVGFYFHGSISVDSINS